MKELLVNVDFNNGCQYRYKNFVQNDSESCQITIISVQDLTDKTVILNAKLPDDTAYVIEMTVVDSETAELIIPTDILSQVGVVKCQVAIHEGTTRLTSWSGFSYKVVEDISDGASSEIEDRLPYITQLTAELEAMTVWEDYNASTEYVAGNKVYFENNSYIATQTTQGNEPALVSNYWQLIVRGFDYEISINDDYELVFTRE